MGDVYAEATSTLPEAPEPSQLPVPVLASDEEMGLDGDNRGTLLGDTPTIFEEGAPTVVPEGPTATDANPAGRHRKRIADEASIAEPDPERISSRRSSLLDDLPAVIRTTFERARAQEGSDAAASSSGQFATREAFVAFMSTQGYTSPVSSQKQDEPSSSGVLYYRNASPELKSKIDESRLSEWREYQHFTASIPIKGK